ncbi:MAG: protein phosphatase 2C domain-containing protein [Candidatus Accumulibacter sp.]|uniref:Protein phosphatase 2C domain-containing protein n=1 Tax=Candidatus Accumulibacter proximus TaxID=2954385 RepID=A0A935PXC3_9PROT|nr:protein phosphatase 2C domain-containing protein [Candidatus Accumulibacter proximus]
MRLFDTSGVSRPGSRTTNMDVWSYAVHDGVGCWVLADGLGGQAHSEVAARVAVQAVLDEFRQQPEVSDEIVEKLIRQANQVVVAAKAARDDLSRIATTIVVLVSDGFRATWGHVGDSRLYHLRNGVVIAQTRDHSVSQARANAGLIDQQQVRSDENRGTLFKALGSAQQVKPTISAPLALCQGDAFLLCVDGFWEKVYEVEMEIDFVKSTNAEEWLGYLERRVSQRQDAESDNYTAIALRIDNPELSKQPGQPVGPATATTIQSGATKPSRQLKGLLVAAALAALILVLVAVIPRLSPVTPPPLPPVATDPASPPKTACAEEWARMKTRTGQQAYKEIRSFGACPEVTVADRSDQEQRICNEEWEGIKDLRSRDAYKTFEKHFDGCSQKKDATARIREVDEWERTDTQYTTCIRKFLDANPRGLYEKDAQEMLPRADKAKVDCNADPTTRCADVTRRWRQLDAARLSDKKPDNKTYTTELKELAKFLVKTQAASCPETRKAKQLWTLLAKKTEVELRQEFVELSKRPQTTESSRKGEEFLKGANSARDKGNYGEAADGYADARLIRDRVRAQLLSISKPALAETQKAEPQEKKAEPDSTKGGTPNEHALAPASPVSPQTPAPQPRPSAPAVTPKPASEEKASPTPQNATQSKAGKGSPLPAVNGATPEGQASQVQPKEAGSAPNSSTSTPRPVPDAGSVAQGNAERQAQAKPPSKAEDQEKGAKDSPAQSKGQPTEATEPKEPAKGEPAREEK